MIRCCVFLWLFVGTVILPSLLSANTLSGIVRILNQDGKAYPLNDFPVHVLRSDGTIETTTRTITGGIYWFSNVGKDRKICPENSIIPFEPVDFAGGSGTYSIDFSVEYVCGVSGTVYIDGVPAQGGVQLAWNDGGTFYNTSVDGQGRYFAGTEPGKPLANLHVQYPEDVSFDPPHYTFHSVWSEMPYHDFRSTSDVSISGRVTFRDNPLEGITVQTSEGATTTTDANGDYRFEVGGGWSGTVSATSADYRFHPLEYTFVDLKSHANFKNFTAYPLWVTISGTILDKAGEPIPDVSVAFSDEGSVLTNQHGEYSKQVPGGWQGAVIPQKAGWAFEPSKEIFLPLDANQVGVDFTGLGFLQVYGYVTIENAPLANVDIRLDSNHGIKEATTDERGYYSISLPAQSSGIIEPSLNRFRFTPEKHSFERLEADSRFDFTAQTDFPYISGRITINNAGLADVMVSARERSGVVKTATTNHSGYYCVILRQSNPFLGWSGRVQPSSSQFKFDPPYRTLYDVKDKATGQDFVAKSPYPTISGRVTAGGYGLAGVVLNTQTRSSYTPVNPKPSPIKPGPITPPPPRPMPWSQSQAGALSMQENGSNESIEQANVESGSDRTEARPIPPRPVTTDENGYYSINLLSPSWSGTIIPQLKEGISGYTPKDRTYNNVTSDQIKQDYQAAFSGYFIAGKITRANGHAVAGVLIHFSGLGSVSTNAEGAYSIAIPDGWSGSAVPALEKMVFSPPIRTYTNVRNTMKNEHYTAFDSGGSVHVFTGSGNWSDAARWSLKRVPKAGEKAQIAGSCNVNVNLPLLQSLLIKPTDDNQLGVAPVLKLNRYRIPDIPVIENEGEIHTHYVEGEPFPADRKLGGTIVFNFNHSDPPETGPRQIIPPGKYNRILLTGNKYAFVNRGTVQVYQLIVKDGSKIGDPKKSGQGQIVIQQFE